MKVNFKVCWVSNVLQTLLLVWVGELVSVSVLFFVRESELYSSSYQCHLCDRIQSFLLCRFLSFMHELILGKSIIKSLPLFFFRRFVINFLRDSSFTSLMAFVFTKVSSNANLKIESFKPSFMIPFLSKVWRKLTICLLHLQKLTLNRQASFNSKFSFWLPSDTFIQGLLVCFLVWLRLCHINCVILGSKNFHSRHQS